MRMPGSRYNWKHGQIKAGTAMFVTALPCVTTEENSVPIAYNWRDCHKVYLNLIIVCLSAAADRATIITLRNEMTKSGGAAHLYVNVLGVRTSCRDAVLQGLVTQGFRLDCLQIFGKQYFLVRESKCSVLSATRCALHKIQQGKQLMRRCAIKQAEIKEMWQKQEGQHAAKLVCS